MHNNTGQHLTNFALDYGGGQIIYQIFSEDYTFAESVEVTSVHTPWVEYFDEEGKRRTHALDRDITPDMAGGVLRVYFEENGSVKLAFDFPD